MMAGRILSLRGCHLLAMFARIPVAKEFRRWVLNILFRLGSYKQLLQSRISEAVDYLMRFEAAPKALPPTDKDSLTVAPGTLPADMKEARKEALKRIVKLSEDARIGFTIVRNIVGVNCSQCGISSRAPDAEHDVCDVLDGLQATASSSLVAAYNALESAYRIGRCYGRG